MEKLQDIFMKNDFEFIRKTTKAVEFENKATGEVIYLAPNKEITIVLNPNTVEKKAILRSDGKLRSTGYRLFPKEQNKGVNPIQYGYAFKFETAEELDSFLDSFNKV